ncbi:hypothetical protein ACFE04_021850 [Oxalis oulophora]
MTGGIDDNVAVIGDWVPHSPNTRAFFSEMLGGEDIVNRSEGLFLGQGFGNTKAKNEATQEGDNQFMRLNTFSEQKPSSRGGLVERMAARAGFNAPRLDTESIRSADLALNNSSGNRSPYLTIPAGLSPTTLLESPVFLSNSLAQPSPTTGKFSFVPGGNGRSSETITEAPDRSKDKFFEDIDHSPPFAFRPLAEAEPSYFTGTAKMPTFPPQSGNSHQSRNVELARANPHAGNNMSLQADFSRSLSEKDNGTNSIASDRRVFNNPIGGSADSPSLDEQQDEGEQRGTVDSMICIGGGGPPSGVDGDSLWANAQNGEWKNDNVEVTSAASGGSEYPPANLAPRNGNFESGDVVEGSSNLSNDEDEDDRATHGSVSLGYDGEGDESESKRRKIEAYATEMSGATRAIREPRVVVQTTSEVDILDDGYRWRKYGQKVVKGNPNPSSHANTGASNNAATQSGGTGQSHAHRAQPSQVHNGMSRFERPPSFCSFSLPGRQQLGPTPGFSFGMNQPGLANLAMAGLGPGQSKLPMFPVHPYLVQQQQQHQQQVNSMGFMLPKGEPKMEPITEPALNISNNSLYQQLMSRLPQM